MHLLCHNETWFVFSSTNKGAYLCVFGIVELCLIHIRGSWEVCIRSGKMNAERSVLVLLLFMKFLFYNRRSVRYQPYKQANQFSVRKIIWSAIFVFRGNEYRSCIAFGNKDIFVYDFQYIIPPAYPCVISYVIFIVCELVFITSFDRLFTVHRSGKALFKDM